MFCPECRVEYVEGITVCVDCDVPLVAELPPEPPEPEPEFVEYEEVLRTFNPGDIAIIRSLLDGADIVYFFRDEHFGYAQPLVQPARLMIRKDQVQEAIEILGDLKTTYTVSAGTPGVKDDD